MRHSQEFESQSQPFHGGLKLLKECPSCTRAFQPTDVEIVDTHQNVHLLHVTCEGCSHALLTLFTVSHAGMSSVGMATDLTAADASRVLDTMPIDEDEMLAFHALLHNTHGARQLEDLFIKNEKNV